MPTYTTPKTWTNEPLVYSDLNTHLRDNMEALKDPPSANYELNESSNYSTTSTSFVDIDATAGKLSLTITTNGGDVLVGFHGALAHSVPDNIYFDIDVDGTRHAGDDGILGLAPYATFAGGRASVSFVRLITGLAAGSHTFKLQWKTKTGTGTLLAGAGTSNGDTHPQFWVREVS